MAASSSCIYSCLRDPEDPAARARLAAMFADPESPTHQTGLLREEGRWRYALIRSSKSYLLRGGLGVQEVRRMRSVPRRVQALLDPEHFGQDATENSPVVNTKAMRPTPGLEVVVLSESRKIPHSLNFKMAAVVSAAAAALLVKALAAPSLYPQDPANTLPLP